MNKEKEYGISDKTYVSIIDGKVLNELILDITQDYYELNGLELAKTDALFLWDRYIKKINKLFVKGSKVSIK